MKVETESISPKPNVEKDTDSKTKKQYIASLS